MKAARAAGSRFLSKSKMLDDGMEFAHGVCRDFEFPPHVHDGLTIGVVTSGREEIQYRNEWRAAERGAVYLLPPDVIHSARSCERDAWSYYSLYLTQSAVRRLGSNSNFELTKAHSPILSGAAANRIRQALIRLASATETLEVQSAVTVILIDLLAPRSNASDETAIAPSSRGKTGAVRDYIDANYADDISLCQLADIAGWSAQHLVGEFKKAFGATPYAYLVARRIAVARNCMMRGEPIGQVAAECGFFDQSHLTRHFVRAYGAAPATYINGLRAALQPI